MSNSTNSSLTSNLISYSCLIFSSILYGGNNLPVKFYETGDGIFFQLIVAIAIWTTGAIVYVIQGFPKFYALPLLGGLFYSSGNMCTVPIIKCIGIGVGSLFWNIVGLVFGWAYARFGWFGIRAEIPSNIYLNYLAICFAILSTIVLLFVKTTNTHVLVNKKIKNNELDIFDKMDSYFKQKFNINWFKHLLGICLSIFSGITGAFIYVPQLYVMSSEFDASQDNNDYAFSLSCGIMLSSLFYFIIYCIVLKNKPKIYPEIIIPSFLTGLLWAIANTLYFIAANRLDPAISFPISNSLPCIVASILGLYYKEIKGTWNLVILFTGLVFTLVSVIICGLSK